MLIIHIGSSITSKKHPLYTMCAFVFLTGISQYIFSATCSSLQV